MTATFVATISTAGFLRPLNIMRDLPAVADLIELCFAPTLDSNGRSYLDQMRRNAHDSQFLSWAPRMIDSVSLPLSGFVWEDGGRVVGNVSLIPFFKRGQRIYLIANVATHPDYRRRGIGRILTEAAMRRACEKKAASIWLHVRQENTGAITLYRDLGFQERACRTNWYSAASTAPPGNLFPLVTIQTVSSHDWPTQREWLGQAHPAELDWYSQNNHDMFQPGLFSSIYRFMADINTVQWSAYRGNTLQGVLSCQRTSDRVEHLWAAFPVHPDPDAFTALLLHARKMLSQTHGLAMEFPSGAADAAIRAAGFYAQRTLIWMEAPGAQPHSI